MALKQFIAFSDTLSKQPDYRRTKRPTFYDKYKFKHLIAKSMHRLENNAKNMKLNSIQFLRAVAATLVVYQHFVNQGAANVESWQKNFYHLKNFGCIGVDLFFVISGFIIMYVANEYTGVRSGFHFLLKRFIRINPIYYIATLLFLLALLIINELGYPNNYVSSYQKIITSLVDTLLIIPTVGDVESFSPFLLVGWTLSFEWCFYLLFFLLILCGVQRKTLFLIILLPLLSILAYFIKPSDFRLIFLTNPILLEFLMGVIICSIYLKKVSIPTYIGVICLFLGIISYILLIIFGFGDVWNYYGVLGGFLSLQRFLLWGLPSTLIVAGCVFLEKNKVFNRVWNNHWIVLAGDASFSIYLFHPILFALNMLLFTKLGYFAPVDTMIVLQVITAIVISIGFYNVVEKPLLTNMFLKFKELRN